MDKSRNSEISVDLDMDSEKDHTTNPKTTATPMEDVSLSFKSGNKE